MFVDHMTSLPDGKSNFRTPSGPADKQVTASEWNTVMQAIYDLRTAHLRDASTTQRGAINTGTQTIGGQKTISIGTGAASDRVLTLGTTLPASGVSDGFGFLSARTNLSGTPEEWLRIQRPASHSSAILRIDQRSQTNTYGIRIDNTPAGVGGLYIANDTGGYINVNSGQFGLPARVYAENKGLHLHQNANAYDAAHNTLMRFTVDNVSIVSSPTTPVFHYILNPAANVGQPMVRYVVNGTEIARITSDGSYIGGPSAGVRCDNVAVGTGGIGVSASTFILRLSSGWALPSGQIPFQFDSNTIMSGPTDKLAVFRNGSTPSTHDRFTIFANGEPEVHTSGAGVILRSPDGTRWRLTVTNTGTLDIVAA